MHISGTSLDHNFIACFSDERVNINQLARNMGKFAIKINDAGRLLDLLNISCKISWKAGRIILMQVVYNKDEYIEMGEDSHLPFEYFIAQKSQIFSAEHEWRAVLVGSALEDVTDDHITINIGSIAGIATSIDL